MMWRAYRKHLAEGLEKLQKEGAKILILRPSHRLDKVDVLLQPALL